MDGLSDEDGRRAAAIYVRIESAKLNGIDPVDEVRQKAE
jgi:hypothetical protein